MRAARVEQLVRSALEPGEEILWMGSPDLRWAGLHAVPHVITVITISWVLLVHRDSLFALILFNLWVSCILPLLNTRIPNAFRDAYAVTDRRAIIVTAGRKPSVRSYRFLDPEKTECVRRWFGRRDILFGAGPTMERTPQPAGFLCVRDAERPKALLRGMATRTGAEPAAAALLDLRAGDQAACSKGLAALSPLGPSADETLARALEDADPCVREAAARAVGLVARERLPSAPVLLSLAACLADPYERAKEAAGQSLEAMTSDNLAPLMRALSAGAGAALPVCLERILGRLSAGIIARNVLDSIRENDRDVAQILYGHLAARPLLRGSVTRDWAQTARTRSETFFPLLRGRPLWARLWVAHALGSAGPTAARRYLASLLESHDWDDRLVAAVGLGFMGDPRAADGLVAALASDDREVRFSAASALSHVGAAAGTALGPLRKLMRTEEDVDLRDACRTAVNRITFALRRQPTELQAAEAPPGRGTEPESAPSPQGTGTELATVSPDTVPEDASTASAGSNVAPARRAAAAPRR